MKFTDKTATNYECFWQLRSGYSFLYY